MNISMEFFYTIYIIILGSSALFMALRYFYVKSKSKKKRFQKPISYVEIRAWREK